MRQSVLGSEELAYTLNNLLVIHEVKQSYNVHKMFLCVNFQDFQGKDTLMRKSVEALAHTVREKKSQNSQNLHHFEQTNQENIQSAHILLFKLLEKVSFDQQSCHASPRGASEMPKGPNRWMAEATETACRKRKLALCPGGPEYQPASEKALSPKQDSSLMNMENLPPVSTSIPFFEDEEDDNDGSESGSASPRGAMMRESDRELLTSPGGSVRSREEERKIKFESFALLVTPTGTRLGWIDINKSSICFATIDSEAELAAFEEQGKSLPMSYMRSFVDAGDGPKKKQELEWHLGSVSLVLVRRYCLRRSAIEFFLADRTSYFFDLGKPELRQRAYAIFLQMRPQNLHSLCYYSQNPERLIKKSEITDKWVRREISNFEYLMYLNTFAGRSYNDITQYVHFPLFLPPSLLSLFIRFEKVIQQEDAGTGHRMMANCQPREKY